MLLNGDCIHCLSIATAFHSVVAMSPNFKIIVIGDAGVGKSSLTTRACNGLYDGNCPPTMGADFYMYTTVIEGVPIIAQLWDTAGQEIYADMCKAYYRGCVLVPAWSWCWDLSFRCALFPG